MDEQVRTETSEEISEVVSPSKEIKGYIESVGRRKTAVARVRISENKSSKALFVVNGKSAEAYFPTSELQTMLREALAAVKSASRYNVEARLTGGGVHAQAEALRHGLARALVALESGWRRPLKRSGFLKRDPRSKERRKFGLKKARKSPQWSKR